MLTFKILLTFKVLVGKSVRSPLFFLLRFFLLSPMADGRRLHSEKKYSNPLNQRNKWTGWQKQVNKIKNLSKLRQMKTGRSAWKSEFETAGTGGSALQRNHSPEVREPCDDSRACPACSCFLAGPQQATGALTQNMSLSRLLPAVVTSDTLGTTKIHNRWLCGHDSIRNENGARSLYH